MENKVYKKNDILNVLVTDLDNDGNGIGKVDGYTLFIKDTYPGDECLVKIMKAKKSYAFAHLEQVVTPSKLRVDAPCPKAKACGGCQIQGMSYEGQLSFKENKVKNNLVRIGGFDADFIDSIWEPIIGSEVPFRYRNKAQYPIGYDVKQGKVIAGFYAGHSHNIILVEDCLLGPEENKDILKAVFRWMKECRISHYDAANKLSGLRHVLIRKGFTTGQIMVCLVVSSQKIMSKEKEEKLAILLSGIEGMTSISYSVNTEDTNVIMGDNYTCIWGEPTIEDYIGELRFKISPLSFFQVNPAQTVKLYGKALEYAALTGGETVWDLYCGIGTISLFMASKAKVVYGVEIIPQAIDDAIENAKLNGLDNTVFLVGKAEEVLPREIKADEEKAHPDVIVVDPPRKGCDSECLNTMLSMSPDRIVYVSCDSATLARDLRILVDGGYELVKATACDMFSQSVHVETVVLMSRVK